MCGHLRGTQGRAIEGYLIHAGLGWVRGAAVAGVSPDVGGPSPGRTAGRGTATPGCIQDPVHIQVLGGPIPDIDHVIPRAGRIGVLSSQGHRGPAHLHDELAGIAAPCHLWDIGNDVAVGGRGGEQILGRLARGQIVAGLEPALQ